MSEAPPVIHHECPRCDESVFFDEDAQVCDRCEWGLDAEPTATPDVSFTVDLEDESDARNAAHTLLHRLQEMAAKHPDTITRVEVGITEVAHRDRPRDDL